MGYFPIPPFLHPSIKAPAVNGKLPWSNGKLLILAGITSIQGEEISNLTVKIIFSSFFS